MSTTDVKGRVTYANAAFIAVSGFSRDEIAGQPHNLVRHPDMPPEAYADMWATMQGGQSWTALVKNRRKDGDHYWVRANATPIMRHGRHAGYMSVRTKPSPEEIAAAEELYCNFREGRQGSRKFHKGLIVRTGVFGWMSILQTMPARWRLRCGVWGLGAAVTAGAAIGGLIGTPLAWLAGSTAFFSLVASSFLEAQIAAPLQKVLTQAQDVAAGQARQNVQLNRVDEIGMILRAINQAGLNLRSLVDDVHEQVSGLQTASAEIAQGNQDLSARTESAASNLEETAASMEEMTATVRNNADTAH